MKHKAICTIWGILLLLISCQQTESSQEGGVDHHPLTAASIQPVAVAPNTIARATNAEPSAAQLYAPLRSSADTLLRIGGQQLYLELQARLDTTQRLVERNGQDTAASGYQGYFSFVLRDSLHQLLAKRVLTEQTFYKAIEHELVISSGAHLPMLLGYSVPMKTLIFTLSFAAPETDWMCNAVLLLDIQGRVRRLSGGYSVGGPAVDVELARDGLTILTGVEILRASGSPLPLQRSNAELRGALLLNDSLALTVYEFGHYQAERSPEGYVSQVFRSTPSQQRQPNAFVLNTRTGQTVNRFRYDGFYEELGVTIPWDRLASTHTGYFLDDKKGLYLVSEAPPTRTSFRPFSSLTKFTPPQRRSEVALTLNGYSKAYMLYVDTLNPASIRYQYERTALD